MRNMIEEAVKCVRADDSLPSDLLAYLSRLIREAREALDEYELTGDFKLSVAFDRLCNALRVAETKRRSIPCGKSSMSSSWFLLSLRSG